MEESVCSPPFSLEGALERVIILGEEYQIRPITRAEVRLIQKEFDNEIEFEDAMVARCLIKSPSWFNYDTIPAGIVSELANSILDISGMTTPETQIAMLEEARHNARSAERSFDLLILSAFPQYKLSDIEELTADEWFELVALAERALVELGRVAPEELVALIRGPEINQPPQQGPPQPMRPIPNDLPGI